MALAKQLLKMFAIGHLSGTQVQTLAAASWVDGGGRLDPLSRKLARHGRGPSNNPQRDVVNAAREHGMMSTQAEPYEFELPQGKGTAIMMLPHEVLAKMVEDRLDRWSLGQRANDPDEPFSNLLRRWCEHPDVMCTTDPGSIVMMGLHADGVQYSSNLRAGEGRKILVASWNVISAESPEDTNRRQPLIVLPSWKLCSCGCSGYHTYQAVFHVLAWSLTCLLRGEAPAARHDGDPFTDADRRPAAGSRLPVAGLMQLRGDWEYMATAFRLRWFTSERFCWMCQASSNPEDEMFFHDISRDAPHRGTLISHAFYMECCARERAEPSSIFEAPGVTLDMLVVDAMHAADLGLFQECIHGQLCRYRRTTCNP
jgi:hypothetical protein